MRLLLASILLSSFLFSCKKDEVRPGPERFCVDCKIEVRLDKKNGYAGSYEATEKRYCDITEQRLEQILKEGNYRKEVPNGFGGFYTEIKKTSCSK